MKKKILGMLGAMCMALVMMPMTVKAVPAESITIAGQELNTDTPYYHNGTEGAVGTANNTADGANATFDASTGTLTLNNLNVNADVAGIAWEGNLNILERDLTIILVNDTTNTIKNMSASAISGGSGAGRRGPSVTIEGSGTLKVTGQSSGFWVWQNVTIQDSAKVDVDAKSNVGICNNSTTGVITIKDNAIVNVQGATYGIGFDHNFTNSMQIQGGTLTVTGGTAAFQATPTLDNSKLWTVNVGADAGGATTWDSTTDLKNYKYVSIVYAGEKPSLTGTASISGTAVYGEVLTAALADSNNTGTLTYTWKAGDTVLQESTGNTYTINSESAIGKTITVTVTSSSHSGSVTGQLTAAVAKREAASAPANLQGVKPSTAGGADGKITGTAASMEYSTTQDFASKTGCGNTETTGLTAGTYYVRYAETATVKESAYVTVVVPEGDAVVTPPAQNPNPVTPPSNSDTSNDSDDTDDSASTSYQIINGAGSSWVPQSNGNLSIRGDGDYNKFTGVKVDGNLIGRENYDVQSGSTIVTLKVAYLQTLSSGNHSFEMVWTDGSATTTFTVANGKKDSVPKTGEESMLGWLLALMAVSGAGVLFTGKRKFFR